MTAQSDLPAPLVPHDIDILGLPAFMLDVERLFASELWAISTGEEFKAAVALWGRAWQQQPAGSLPNDERLLAAFSGAGARWKKVRAMALRGFILCSDNRLYHRVLCVDVLRAAKHKDQRRERTAAATKARLAKGDCEPTPPPKSKKPNGINETLSRNEERHEDRNEQRDEERNEVRHEERNVDLTMTLRPTLRSPIDRTGQDRRKKIGGDGGEPVPGEPPRREAWACRENFDRVERRCREALPNSWVQDLVVGPMARLEADGLDLEAEIIPAILGIVASRRTPIRTWSMLANVVAERVAAQRDARTAQGLSAKPAARLPEAEMVDMRPHGQWAEPTLRQMIARHRESPSAWIEAVFGPAPGQPGCRVPARLLIEEAA